MYDLIPARSHFPRPSLHRYNQLFPGCRLLITPVVTGNGHDSLLGKSPRWYKRLVVYLFPFISVRSSCLGCFVLFSWIEDMSEECRLEEFGFIADVRTFIVCNLCLFSSWITTVNEEKQRFAMWNFLIYDKEDHDRCHKTDCLNKRDVYKTVWFFRISTDTKRTDFISVGTILISGTEEGKCQFVFKLCR